MSRRNQPVQRRPPTYGRGPETEPSFKVDALIKADKRFDMLYLPATRHGFGSYQPYVTQRMYEYFAEHLLDDYQSAANLSEKD